MGRNFKRAPHNGTLSKREALLHLWNGCTIWPTCRKLSKLCQVSHSEFDNINEGSNLKTKSLFPNRREDDKLGAIVNGWWRGGEWGERNQSLNYDKRLKLKKRRRKNRALDDGKNDSEKFGCMKWNIKNCCLLTKQSGKREKSWSTRKNSDRNEGREPEKLWKKHILRFQDYAFVNACDREMA